MSGAPVTRATVPRATVRVGLLWHSLRSDNLGLVALTEGHVALLGRAAERAGVDLELTVFGRGGASRSDETEVAAIEEFPVPTLRRLWRRDSDFARRLAACDLVFDVGEGDGFSDVYGALRLATLVLPRLVLRRGRRRPLLVMAPQTVGPFETWWGRALGRAGLRAVERIYARDPASGEASGVLVPSRPCGLTTDLSLATRGPGAGHPGERRETGETMRVGINVSALLWGNGYSGRNELGLRVDYRALVTRLVENLAPRAEVHLLAHVVRGDGSVEDDYAVARSVAGAGPQLELAPRFSSPGQARQYMAELDHMVGARLHACLGALSCRVPITCLAYTRKAETLLGALGYDGVIDLRAVDTDTAVSRVLAAVNDSARLARRAAAAMDRAGRLLDAYEDDLVALLGRMAQGSRR
jgi:colanic acid/amylovoran biosynthesis protein